MARCRFHASYRAIFFVDFIKKKELYVFIYPRVLFSLTFPFVRDYFFFEKEANNNHIALAYAINHKER